MIEILNSMDAFQTAWIEDVKYYLPSFTRWIIGGWIVIHIIILLQFFEGDNLSYPSTWVADGLIDANLFGRIILNSLLYFFLMIQWSVPVLVVITVLPLVLFIGILAGILIGAVAGLHYLMYR